MPIHLAFLRHSECITMSIQVGEPLVVPGERTRRLPFCLLMG